MKTMQTRMSAKALVPAALGIGAGVVVLLAVLPQTGWLVREQLGGKIGGAESAAVVRESLQTVTPRGLSPKLQQAAQANPGNLGMQIAATMQRAREARNVPQSLQTVTDFWELRDRFGNNPVYCANYLRFACWAAPNIGREWERDLVSDTRAKADDKEAKRRESKAHRIIRWRDEPEFAARALEIAKHGAQVDAGNAFFPYMEAVVYTARNRDAEAHDALHRAAMCSRFQDYAAAEAEGRIALQEAAQGTQGAVSRAATASAVLFPHFSTLRATAQVAAADAIAYEANGEPEKGFQIRHDLARIGAIMRYDGSFGITNLVGIAITGIAGNKPAGQDLTEPTPRDGKRVTAQREKLYRNYLARTGHADEAVWFQQERQRGETVRDLMAKSMDSSNWGLKPLASLVAWWCAGVILLANALWMLVGGAIAVRVGASLRNGKSSEAAPLSHPSRLGLGAVSIATLTGLLSYLTLAVNGTEWLAIALVLIALFTGAVLAPLVRLRRNPLGNRQEMSRDRRQEAWRQSRTLYIRTTGAALAVLAGVVTVAAHLLRQVEGVATVFAVFTSGTASGESGDTSRVAGQLLTFFAIAAITAMAPLSTAVVATVCSRRHKMPVSASLVGTFRRVALPVTTILLVLYSVVALLTVGQEQHLWREMNEEITHEGRYGAGLLHQPWPDRVAEVASHP